MTSSISFSEVSGDLPERLRALLGDLPVESRASSFELDELSLRLGQRLPDQAQTMTYWQRGDLGRTLRAAGFRVGVELGSVIFVRADSRRRE